MIFIRYKMSSSMRIFFTPVGEKRAHEPPPPVVNVPPPPVKLPEIKRGQRSGFTRANMGYRVKLIKKNSAEGNWRQISTIEINWMELIQTWKYNRKEAGSLIKASMAIRPKYTPEINIFYTYVNLDPSVSFIR